MTRKKRLGVPSGIPADAQLLPHRILREGEHTGHAHAAVDVDAQLFISGDQLIMRAPHGTEIVHEEHNQQSWPPGTYDIGAVRERDHFEEETREVAD